jgi:F-type H+-transporting ATPase subunit alpha
MAISLFAANEGYLDDVDFNKVVSFETALHAYMRSDHADLLKKINDSGDYNDEIEAGLRKVVEEFKNTQAW